MVVDSASLNAVETALQALPHGSNTLLICTDKPAERSGQNTLMRTTELLESGRQQCAKAQLQGTASLPPVQGLMEPRRGDEIATPTVLYRTIRIPARWLTCRRVQGKLLASGFSIVFVLTILELGVLAIVVSVIVGQQFQQRFLSVLIE